MRYYLIALTTLCLLLAACGKDVQYSTWTVNGEGFSTNEVRVTETERQMVSYLAGGETENRFSLNFSHGTLPNTGKYLIRQSHYYTEPEVKVMIYYNSTAYRVSLSEKNFMEASSSNNKVSYYMPPTWFVNYDDVNDSVLIEGTFKEA